MVHFSITFWLMQIHHYVPRPLYPSDDMHLLSYRLSLHGLHQEFPRLLAFLDSPLLTMIDRPTTLRRTPDFILLSERVHVWAQAHGSSVKNIGAYATGEPFPHQTFAYTRCSVANLRTCLSNCDSLVAVCCPRSLGNCIICSLLLVLSFTAVSAGSLASLCILFHHHTLKLLPKHSLSSDIFGTPPATLSRFLLLPHERRKGRGCRRGLRRCTDDRRDGAAGEGSGDALVAGNACLYHTSKPCGAFGCWVGALTAPTLRRRR